MVIIKEMQIPGDYLKLVHVAKKLDVSEHTVRSWIRQGALKAKQVRRRWYVSISDLNAFLSDYASKETTKTLPHDAP